MDESVSLPASLLQLALRRLVSVPAGSAWGGPGFCAINASMPRELKQAYFQSLQPSDVDAVYAAGQTAVLKHIGQHIDQYRNFRLIPHFAGEPAKMLKSGNTLFLEKAWMIAAAKRRHWDVAIFHLERMLQQCKGLLTPVPSFFEAVGESGLNVSELPTVLRWLKESSVWLYPQKTLESSQVGDIKPRRNSILGRMYRGYVKAGHMHLLPSRYQLSVHDIETAALCGRINVLERVDLTNAAYLNAVSYAAATTPSIRPYLLSKGVLHMCSLYNVLVVYRHGHDLERINRVLCLLADLREGRVDCLPIMREDLLENMGTALAAIARHRLCSSTIQQHLTEYISRRGLSVDVDKSLLDLCRDDVPLYNGFDKWINAAAVLA